MKEYRVHHVAASGFQKAMLAERAIRTVRTILTKKLHHTDSANWPSVLQDVLQIINERKHSATGMAPNDVTPETASLVFERLYPQIVKDLNPKNAIKPKFFVGQTVRCLAPTSNKYEKGDTAKMSQNIFIVAKILYHPLYIRYKLKDSITNQITLGTYNESELIPVNQVQNE